MSKLILKEFIDTEVRKIIKESYQLSAKDMNFLRRYPVDFIMNQTFFDDEDVYKHENLYEFIKNKGLVNYGEGSSRIVYGISTTKVIKVAKNKFGLTQNKQEVNVYTQTNKKYFVPKIYDYHPEYLWIISEAVKSFFSEEAFTSKIGVDSTIIKDLVIMSLEGSLPENVSDYPEDIRVQPAGTSDFNATNIKKSEILDKKFLQTLIDFVDEGLISYGDIKYQQFGVNIEGKVVIVDTGL